MHLYISTVILSFLFLNIALEDAPQVTREINPNSESLKIDGEEQINPSLDPTGELKLTAHQLNKLQDIAVGKEERIVGLQNEKVAQEQAQMEGGEGEVMEGGEDVGMEGGEGGDMEGGDMAGGEDEMPEGGEE
ncbi:hypothetical protein COBT_000440 [Conglomerata obtusa]